MSALRIQLPRNWVHSQAIAAAFSVGPRFLYEKLQRKQLAIFCSICSPEGYGVFAVAKAKNQTHFLSDSAVACYGDGDRVCDFGDWLEISTGGVFAAGDGGYVLRNRSNRGDHPGGRVAEA